MNLTIEPLSAQKMTVFTKNTLIKSKYENDIIEITDEVTKLLKKAKFKTALS